MANEVEKIESNIAVEAVQKADDKVQQIKAEKAAKKAKRQNDRLVNWKWKVAAKVANYVENNIGAVTLGMAVGGPGAVLLYESGKRIYQKYKDKGTEEAVTEPETTEPVEPPFDTEA